MKVALLVAYDGAGFRGFARQRDARTVQGLLEERLEALFRSPVAITGAGRTDAGVHASGQVVSFVAPEGTEPSWLASRLNRWIAPEVSVRAAARVPADFDARFGALGREYEYRCYAGPAPDPFLDRYALWAPWPLALAPMRLGARALVGEHDFSAFCRRGDGTMVRRLRSVSVMRAGERLTIRAVADSFCHKMVRSIVGLLLEVGRDRRASDEVAAALATRDRARAGPVAPPHGLHLVRVRYRPDPFRVSAARRVGAT